MDESNGDRRRTIETRSDRLWRRLRGLSLRSRLILAILSGLGYWPAVLTGERLYALFLSSDADPYSPWGLSHPLLANLLASLLPSGQQLAGLLFGALVTVFYVTANTHRGLRALAMCVVTALIFALAFRLGLAFWSSDGLWSELYGLVPAVLAAILTGAVVTVLGPYKPRWRTSGLFPLAGGIAGVLTPIPWLDAELSRYLFLVPWQVAVCLALHFAFGTKRV